MSLILSFSLVPAAATSIEAASTENECLVLDLNGKEIEFTMFEADGVQYVVYQEAGQNHIASYNPSSGMLLYDNKTIPITIHENFSDSNLNLLNIQANSTGSGQWVHYGIDAKVDIDISGMAAGAATAAVLALVGNVHPAAAVTVGAAVAKFLDDNVSGIVALSLKKVSYYWDPVTTQRPKTKTDFYLYSGKGCKPQNLLCQF